MLTHEPVLLPDLGVTVLDVDGLTTTHTVTPQVGDTVPIGTPVAGTRVHVLDENLRPVPVGEWGELYTGGAGLACGYLNRPGPTAERFLPDPFVPGERLYRVGDVVRRNGNGELSRALRHRLPQHMIPAVVMVVTELPLTRAGKLDRAALPAPESDVDDTYAAPRTPVEATLAGVFADAPAVERVGIHDDFFDIGGNSLIAADVLARLRGEMAVELPAARLFFENPTVAGLAEHAHPIDDRTSHATDPPD